MWEVTAAEVKTTMGEMLTIPYQEANRSSAPFSLAQPMVSCRHAKQEPVTEQKCGLQSPSLSITAKTGFETERSHLVTNTMALQE